jgi:hypothetical protein
VERIRFAHISGVSVAMDEAEESVPTTPAASQDKVRRRLATVQLLLSTERTATQHDILIATAFEALRSGPKSDVELEAFANDVWPGAGVTSVQIQMALGTAEAAGLIKQVPRLDASLSWAITDPGLLDMSGSDDWARSVVIRCEDFLMNRGSEAFGDLDRTTAHLWMGILEDALFAGIRDAFTGGEGGVRTIGSATLAPKGYDLSLMFGIVDEHSDNEGSRGFLKSMVVEALDPSNPFGSELVHTIATGYILHSFLARRDLVGARQEVGSLTNQCVLLDTPMLLRLLGSEETSGIVWKAIRSTIEQEVSIVLHRETIRELESLLSRVTDDAAGIEGDLANGSLTAALAELVDQLPLKLWLDRVGRGESLTWSQFCDQVTGLVTKLEREGVTVRMAASNYSLSDSALFALFREALGDFLASRNSSRGTNQIAHDAYLLVAADRIREAHVDDGLWPGAVILTIDTALTPSYRSAKGLGTETFPMALTLSQWIGIITNCAAPAAAEALARTVPAEVAYETLLSIAVRFPIESARTLAKVLIAGDAAGPTDLRYAQLTIDDVLRDQPDIVDNPIQAANQVATIVIAERGRRLSLASSAQREFASNERIRAEKESAISKALAQREQRAREEAEARAITETKRADTAETDLAIAELRAKRMPVIYIAISFGFIAAIVLGLLGLWGFMIGTLIGVGVLWRQGDEWSRDPNKSWLHLLTALIPEVLGAFDFFRK